MFFCKFPASICPTHKHLVLYHYLYRIQEHENKTIINVVAGTIKAYRRFNHVKYLLMIHLIRHNLHQRRVLMGTILTVHQKPYALLSWHVEECLDDPLQLIHLYAGLLKNNEGTLIVIQTR
ncbi:hypothetical protein M9H77_14141 [Catharanthus roseus]|uniref:Uncharacterized protein n=1 Tax=Catharanthus roseus TaxID=4058 RepID=A0ACC0BM63_CATRO|nr:hypothetical protein M9H77_14141 [Catharanthus roseus]